MSRRIVLTYTLPTSSSMSETEDNMESDNTEYPSVVTATLSSILIPMPFRFSGDSVA